jgi:hypothetical protein
MDRDTDSDVAKDTDRDITRDTVRDTDTNMAKEVSVLNISKMSYKKSENFCINVSGAKGIMKKIT